MTYSSAGTPASIAPAAGLLIAVTDSFGRQLGFTYNAQRRVNSMTDPAGGQYLFEYDGSGGPAGAGNLTKLTFPDTKTRVYLYKEAAQINGGAACSSPSPVLNNALTGLSDENDSRYATWTYDCQARVTSSVHALGVGLYSFNYGTGTSTAYLDSLGTSRSVGLQRTLGVARGTGTTQPAANGSGTVSTSATYDANGNIASRTDWNGNQTIYTFDPARNLEISRTQANGTPQQRTTSTDWHPTFRLPTQIVEPLRTTTSVYDADGAQCGARGALCSRSVQATSGATRTWTYTYNANGQVLTVNGPRSDVSDLTTYTYDAQGNVASITNAAGHVTSITVYNAHGQPLTIVDPNGMTTTLGYDPRQRLTSRNSGGEVTSSDYDALNRLWRVSDAGVGVTQYGYNSLDALTQVTDPRNLVTGYSINGLGNLTQQSSPDTGSTVNTYDAAGNLLTQTDVKGQLTTYTYDALNRVTLITFNDGSKQSYSYDQGANGIGHLTSITEMNPANQVTSQLAYAYDLHGRVTGETRTVGGVQYVLAYAYDSAGRLTGLTYPSGRTVTYTFDGLGRVNQVTTTKDSQSQVVVSSVLYQPFGGVKGYTLGNGQVYSRGIDLDGRIASYTLGAQSFGIGYDAASRIQFISDFANSANTNNYDYDSLDRLTQAVTPSTPYAYSYDAVGNRMSRAAGASTDSYAYSSSSNRVASITPSSGPVRSFVFDPNGSTTADGNNTYTYDTRGRMVQATSSVGATSYQVNALGQRIRKTNSLGDTVFHYDTRGHLIAETDAAGGVKRELIYLGDVPVGVVH